jgi:hypothetical protein
VSDQQPQPTSGETGTLGAGPATPDMPAPGEPVTAAAEVEAAKLAPEQEESSPKPDAAKDAPKVDAPKVDAVKMEAPKVEASKAEPPKIDAVKPEAPRFPGNVTIMSPGDRVGADAKAAPAEGSAGKRRIGAMAAVVALATVAGALGGALATAGVGKLMAGDSAQESAQASAQASAKDSALEASVARIDAEIVALKSSLEHNSKTTTGQLNKASDRLDKVEKAQAEPATKLAKLSETVDKLRAAQASATTAAAAPAPAKEVTGSIPQQAAAAAAPAAPPASGAPPKPEVARLPTVEGWVLRDVANGSALIESRRGMYEVYAGDPIPGLGRVDAIRKQDGRWVVVTSKGLIVAR